SAVTVSKLLSQRPQFQVYLAQCRQGGPEISIADELPYLRHARHERWDRQGKLGRFLQRTLFIDQIAFVEREQGLRQACQRAVDAACDMRLLAAHDSKFGIFDAEQDFPTEASNERVAELLRIG